MLAVTDLGCSFGAVRVLEDISVRMSPGLNVIVGPNAAGKTTFLNCLAGLADFSGRIELDGEPLQPRNGTLPSGRISYLPQQSNHTSQLSVFEAVLLGRLSSLSLRVSKRDRQLVSAALEEFGLGHLAARPMSELSGGQQQLISIAQVLVRKPRVLILDEPTNNLDLSRQLEIFELIGHLTRQRQLITVMALHDLNFALRFADRVVVFDNGTIASNGPPEKVFSANLLRDIYGIEASIVYDQAGIPLVVPIRSVNEVDRDCCRSARYRN